MGNQTMFYEFVLSGFSDLPDIQMPLFLLFFLIYLVTLMWNLLILLLILTDFHLHAPMYFFLGHLAVLDLCCSSVTGPRMLFDLHIQRRVISRSSCIVQIYFFIFFASTEVLLLAIMSCDRYLAICRPLHYMQIMHLKVCSKLALGAWTFGLLYSLVHSLCTLRLTFCSSNTIHNFFCDISHLFQLSCSDASINIIIVFLFGGLLGASSLAITFVPYISIFSTVLQFRAKNTRLKAFSTCTSHLSVVFIFYGSLVLNFFRPNTGYHFSDDRLLSVCYTVITPMLNPLIYSLRNQELRGALRRTLNKMQ